MNNELPRKGIREWRLGLFLTQADLAVRVGVKQLHTISDWETGVTRPRIHQVPKLAEALGIKPEQIIWPERRQRQPREKEAA